MGLPNYYGTPKTPGDAINLASKVAKAIAEIAVYDINPRGYDASGSALIQFLSTVRRGYCVQYATAAALLLRMMGVPARYCEGFIARDFKNTSDGSVATVKDSDAHAWIEIYVENYGWMTFEMTESVAGATVSFEVRRDETTSKTPDVTTDEDVTTRAGETRPPVTDTTDEAGRVTDPPVTTKNDGGERDSFPAWALTAAVFVALAVAAVAAGTAAERGRKRFIADLTAAASRAGANSEKDQRKYTEYIFRLLGYVGLRQGSSELLADFADRAGKTPGMPFGFRDVALVMQRLTFGGE
jgi:hypothetical protein